MESCKVLPKQYLRTLYKSFVEQITTKKQIDDLMRPQLTNKDKTIGRIANFPEYISENLVVYALHNIGIDSVWNRFNKETGDIIYYKEGMMIKGEVKCKQNGPSQFSPSSKWETLFYIDATCHYDGDIKIYMIEDIQSISLDNMLVSKTQTFKEQKDAGRRPRFDIDKNLSKYLTESHLVYKGTINNLIAE